MDVPIAAILSLEDAVAVSWFVSLRSSDKLRVQTSKFEIVCHSVVNRVLGSMASKSSNGANQEYRHARYTRQGLGCTDLRIRSWTSSGFDSDAGGGCPSTSSRGCPAPPVVWLERGSGP